MNKPNETTGSTFTTAVMLGIVLVAILAGVVAAYGTAIPTALAAPNQGHASPMQVTVTASQSVSVSMTASVPLTQSMTVTAPSTQTQQLPSQTSESMTTMQSSASSSQTVSTVQTSTSVTVAQPTTSIVTTQTMTTTSPAAQYCGYSCNPNYPNPPYYPGYYGGYYPGYYGGYPSYPSYANAYGACGYGVGYGGNVQCTGYIYQNPNGCTELVIQVVNPYTYTSALQYYTLHNLTSTPPAGTLVTVQGQMYQGSNTSSTGAACPGNYINVSSITTA